MTNFHLLYFKGLQLSCVGGWKLNFKRQSTAGTKLTLLDYLKSFYLPLVVVLVLAVMSCGINNKKTRVNII